MHFLCLHGMGTNGQVLETSFATVRYEMDPSHTFDFPDGCVVCPIAPEIKAYYPSEDEYYQYYDSHSASSINLALSQIETYIQHEGPFDGVLGFSQGATLLATYIARQTHRHPSRPLPFRCAIFFSGGIPFDTRALDQGATRLVDPKETGPTLDLPTANIWGHNDKVWPGASEQLSDLCVKRHRMVYVHNEGHSIPGPRTQEAVLGCVKAIKRAIGLADMAQ